MKTVIIADIYPGAQFKQDGSIKTLIVDSINDDAIVFFHNVNDETGEEDVHTNEQFDNFIFMLNVAGYNKIN
jgi:hypothetical protein